MKIFIGAFALVIAAPAAAQTAPSADPHAGHGQHQGQHPAGHGNHKSGDHADHKMGCCKGKDGKPADCCAKAKQAGQKMACCEGKSGAERAGHSSH